MIKLTDLAAKIAAKHFLKPQEVESFLTLMADVLNHSLQEKKQVKVKGLGTFKVATMNARESVDVNTGERIMIESREKISFVPDASMRDWVNSPFAQFDTVVVNEGVDLDKLNEIEEQPEVEETEVPEVEEQTAVVEEETPAVEEEVSEVDEQIAVDSQMDEVEEQPVVDSEENEVFDSEMNEVEEEPVVDSEVEVVDSEENAVDSEMNEVEEKFVPDFEENEMEEQPVFKTEEMEAENPFSFEKEEHFGEKIEFVDHFESDETTDAGVVFEDETETEVEAETEVETEANVETKTDVEEDVLPAFGMDSQLENEPRNIIDLEDEVKPEVTVETEENIFPKVEVEPTTVPKITPLMEPQTDFKAEPQADTSENSPTPPLPYKDPKMHPDYLLERIKKKNVRIGILTTVILALLGLMLFGFLYFYHGIKERDARISNLVGELQGFTQNRVVNHSDSVEMQKEEWASKGAEAKKARLDEVREAAARRFHEHERRVEEEMSKITTIPNSAYEHAVTTTKTEPKAEPASVEAELTRKEEAARKQAETTSKQVVKDPDLSVYNNNPKVRAGSYVIIGVGQTVTVRDGQSFSGISKAYLGPGMEDYLEVVNGGIRSVRPGQKLRLPILRKKQADD